MALLALALGALCAISTGTPPGQEPEVVVAPGPPGTWDSSSIYGPTVVEHDGRWHMFYVGNQVVDSEDRTKNMGLGYASSEDGVTWKKHGDGPVLVHPSERRATGCAVLVEDGRWIVLYGVPRKDYDARGELYLAVGPGPAGPWQARAEPVLRSTPGAWNERVMPVGLFRVDGEYRLYYYSLNRELDTSGFGLATSPDLESWELAQDPLLTPGEPGEWDGVAVTSASVLRGEEGWQMFYVGYDRPITQRDPADPPLWMGRATSSDGVEWTRDPANPVLQTTQTVWPLTSVVRRGTELCFYQDTDGGLSGIHRFTADLDMPQEVPDGSPRNEESAQATFEVTTLALDRKLVSYGRLGGVAIGADGTVFVSNFGPDVWAVSPQGKVTPLASDFQQASGNALGPDGTLLQADFARKAIYTIDPETGETSPLVTTGLSSPVGLVADDEWNLYVCDCNANSVFRVSPDGAVRTLASGALFACPNGITRDAAGNLYVVNFANDLLVKIDARGRAATLATVGAGGGNAHVALAGLDIYVTKIQTNELFAVRVDAAGQGEVRLVAGNGKPEIRDGPGTRAGLRSPNGLAAGPDGRYLVTNNIVGTWREKTPTELVLRRIELP